VRKLIFADAGPEVDVVLVGERRQRLEALGDFRIHYGDPESAEEYLERTRGADAMMIGGPCVFPAEVMRQVNLEVISFTGRGAATYVDFAVANELGITVCIAPGAAEATVAEHAIALMLAAARHLPRLDRDVRNGYWNHATPAVELHGKKLGLLGCGPIAILFGRLAKGIGMEVRAWTPHPSPERAQEAGFELVSQDEILEESDVLSMHLAHKPETEGFLGAKELARTKKGVVVVNSARGGLIDGEALADLLRSGHIAAAGMDVFPEEPCPTDHPLLQLDNVVLTPHVAWNTPEATDRLYDISIDNLVNYYAGSPTNVVAGPV
jgi:D-3-phosphoglycerate dehydrogenase